MSAQIGIEVFTTRNASGITGISMILLETWIRTGFITPSVLGATGRGSRRVFSFRDLIALAVAVRLRELGVGLETTGLVVKHLQSRKGLSAFEPLAPTMLITDGKRVIEIADLTGFAELRRPDAAMSVVISLDQVVAHAQETARTLRREPPKTAKSENSIVKRAAARARRAA